MTTNLNTYTLDLILHIKSTIYQDNPPVDQGTLSESALVLTFT
jgi:hypothetical protein